MHCPKLHNKVAAPESHHQKGKKDVGKWHWFESYNLAMEGPQNVASIRFPSSTLPAIGIDLGGTKTEVAAVDSTGRVCFRERCATPAEEGPEAIRQAIVVLFVAARASLGSEAQGPLLVGMGTPGSIDLDSGLLRNSNTLCLNGLRLEEWISTAIGQAVVVENDANCFALAEATLGAGRGSRVVFGVILGTGCGAGLVVDGQLHVGPNRLAGEWGHLSIDPAGPLCWCGQRGCLETLVSGGGLAARWLEQTGERVSAKSILSNKGEGNRRFTDRWIGHLCRGLKGVVQTIDPDAIVLGGGLSNHPGLAEAIGRGLAGTLFGAKDCRTPVLVNGLGDSAGVLGAVLYARRTRGPEG